MDDAEIIRAFMRLGKSHAALADIEQRLWEEQSARVSEAREGCLSHAWRVKSIEVGND